VNEDGSITGSVEQRGREKGVAGLDLSVYSTTKCLIIMTTCSTMDDSRAAYQRNDMLDARSGTRGPWACLPLSYAF